MILGSFGSAQTVSKGLLYEEPHLILEVGHIFHITKKNFGRTVQTFKPPSKYILAMFSDDIRPCFIGQQ